MEEYKMKHFIVTLITLFLLTSVSFAAETTAVMNGDNLVVTVTLTKNEQAFAKNDLLSIQDWVQGAVVGKVNKCKTRMNIEWDAKMKADPTVTSIPTDEAAWLEAVTKRADYKSRPKREADNIQTQVDKLTTDISKEADTEKKATLEAQKSTLEAEKTAVLSKL
jgi:hypothetical protein